MAEEDDTGTEETEEETGTEETEEETGTEEEKGYKAPSEADWKKTQAALKRAQTEAKKLRLAAKAKPEEKPKIGQQDDQQAQTDLRLKRSAGIAALTEEGLTRAQAKVAVRLLDLDQVDLDVDGDADVEELIEDLKETFPQLFTKQDGGRGRVPRVTTADRGRGSEGGTGTGGKKTPDDRINDRLLRQAGYR